MLNAMNANNHYDGDPIAKRFRQVTTAVGDGTVAALAASNYVHQLKVKNKLELSIN
jgi:hypothetical protein